MSSLYGLNTSAPIDWADVTFTVTFTGPKTFTDASLKANSSEQVVVPMPTDAGIYQVNCAFNGTGFIAEGIERQADHLACDGEHQSPDRAVSGCIQDPATVRAGQVITWTIVVLKATGLPYPYRQRFRAIIGNSSTSVIALGIWRDGDVSSESANASRRDHYQGFLLW